MFCIKIANIPIGINNRYEFIRHLCCGYETEREKPLFAVSADEEEILQERKEDSNFSMGYCESLCIYRKICYELVRYDAFLMHSAVVAVDGWAYVFAAPSGVGKTTHIKMWLEQFEGRAETVNGDKPIFRFLGDTLYACGTPWCGKECLGKNVMYPVGGICFLEQSPQNHIRSLTAGEVSRHIFSQILLPKEEHLFDQFWNLLERMMKAVDFYLLQCNREPEAAQLAYQTMRRD